MFGCFANVATSLRRSVAVGVVLVAGMSALATDLPPGGTLEPIPSAFLPSGATLERTITKNFDIAFTPPFPPITRHITGTVTQTVYRKTDNTVIFRYQVTNDATSFGAVTSMGARDYSDYTTDVHLQSSLIPSGEIPDRAIRDIFGSSILFQWDLGIPTDSFSRTVVIETNAVSYIVPGRIVPVASRLSVSSGSNTTYIYGFAYPVQDSTPPVVAITGPAQLANNCNPVVISGRAYDTAGFDSYTVEYASNASGPWTTIIDSQTPVQTTGTLATWNTTSVAEGYYFIRLTAFNTAGLSDTITTVVYVDRGFSNLQLRSPAQSNTPPLLGGGVCFDGSVWDTGGSNYTIAYRALPNGVFANVNPATPTYPGQVINDGLGSGWITSSGPTAVPDGLYEVRLQGTDGCGNTATVTRTVAIDNTAPIAVITAPLSCSSVTGQVTVTGVVSDANLSIGGRGGWALQYTGGDAHGWVNIATGTTNVSGVLGVWNTSGLRPCAYTLRLVAADAAAVNCSSTSNQTEYYMGVNVGCPADFNHSGQVNSQDYFDFLTAFFSPCP